MKQYIKSNRDDAYSKANALANEIENLFNENQINAEFWDIDIYEHPMFPRANITFRIDGDWKHDHLFADDLVAEKFGSKVSISITDEEDSDSDWYAAKHVYTIVL